MSRTVTLCLPIVSCRPGRSQCTAHRRGTPAASALPTAPRASGHVRPGGARHAGDSIAASSAGRGAARASAGGRAGAARDAPPGWRPAASTAAVPPEFPGPGLPLALARARTRACAKAGTVSAAVRPGRARSPLTVRRKISRRGMVPLLLSSMLSAVSLRPDTPALDGTEKFLQPPPPFPYVRPHELYQPPTHPTQP